MAKKDYVPRQEGELLKWCIKYKAALPGLQAKYGLSDDELAAQIAACDAIIADINANEAAQHASQGTRKTLNTTKKEKTSIIRKNAQHMKTHSDYDEDDGEALGIRVEHEKPDLNTVKPIITGLTILPTFVEIDWRKNGMDGVYVHGSFDGNSFTQIGTDNRSPWEDTRPNQVPGEAETRHYKMQYMVADKPVGLFSDVVKVVVQIG